MDAGAERETRQLLERLSMTIPRDWSWIMQVFNERLKSIDRQGGDLKALRKAIEVVAALGRSALGNQNVETDAVVAYHAHTGTLLESLLIDLLAEVPASRVLDISRALTSWVDSVNRGHQLRRQTEEQIAIASRDATIRTAGQRMHPLDIIRLSEETGCKLSVAADDSIVCTPSGRLGYDHRIWIDLKRPEIVTHLRSRSVGEAV